MGKHMHNTLTWSGSPGLQWQRSASHYWRLWSSSSNSSSSSSDTTVGASNYITRSVGAGRSDSAAEEGLHRALAAHRKRTSARLLIWLGSRSCRSLREMDACDISSPFWKLEYDVRIDNVRELVGRSRAHVITLVKISEKISTANSNTICLAFIQFKILQLKGSGYYLHQLGG